MAKSFHGKLAVDPSDFNLIAERFIVRDSEISFCLKGQDDDGSYILEGRAEKTHSGGFTSPALSLRYELFRGDYEATIRINHVSETKTGCKVEGEWLQDGDSRQFRGQLRPYKRLIHKM
jgi:hypothetical protein